MNWFDPMQPLWLPEGSVRALLAIFTVVAVVGFFISLGGEVAVAALAGTLASVITFYFTKRQQGWPTLIDEDEFIDDAEEPEE
jgi:4-hydroxybenzoate polyprenyltransferase